MTTRLLYLVRHGLHDKDPATEAEDGNEDGPLNDIGHEQARLLGERLRGTEIDGMEHSSLRRARRTAEILAEYLPGVTPRSTELLRECIPHRPDDELLTPAHVEFFAGWPPAILEHGSQQAAAVVERYAGVRDGRPELLVTHGNVISWLVCEALDVPRWRWLTMPHFNCALTVIAYREERPPALLAFNDAGHLPYELRGTDYPAELRV